MKYLIILISLNCFAGGFVPLEKPNFNLSNYPKLYEHQYKCEEIEGHACYDISACDINVCELVDNIVLDYVAKLEEESCLDISDCDIKFAAKVCAEGAAINNYDLLQVYCTKDVMKVDGKKLQESSVKKAAKAAKEAAREAKRAQRKQNEADALEAVKNLSKSEFDALTAAQKNLVLWRTLQIVLNIRDVE